MATYLDLAQLSGQSGFSDFLSKVAVACAIKAQAIAASGTATAGQIAWAKAALLDPPGQSRIVVNYVLAANNAVTTAQILGASDATIQTAVGDAVDKLLAQ